MGARAGDAAQPRQAPPRPLRPGARGRGHVGPRGLRPRRRRHVARRRGPPVRARQPGERAALRRRRRPLRLGGRPTTGPDAERDRALRGARAQPDRPPPRRPAGAARHVCRAGTPRLARPPPWAGCHGGRAAPRPRVHPRAPPRPPRDDEPLGLQHPGVLRTARGIRLGHRPPGRRRRGQGHGQAAPPRGHRGDPRRRLQPHRRAGRHGRDPVVARPRPAGLLPARRARP